ncbi:TPA: tyrosine-type recombinase/integrase [Burkholderia multivorans]
MNARRRKKDVPWPRRVYPRSGTFWWVRPTDEQWIRLCRVDEGETKMLDRLAEEKRKIEIDPNAGNVPRLIDVYMETHASKYAESFRDEWRRRGASVKTAFSKFDIQQVDAGAIYDFLHDNWGDKPPTFQAMHAWLSKFFAWAVVKRYAASNPCREIEVKKPKKRKVYIPHDHFLAIREALGVYTYEKKIKGETRTITAKVPTGPMMQVFIDLCYLTIQRSTEIRELLWKADAADPFGCSWVDEKAGVIHFVPSKTEDSSGETVDWPITPEIQAVLARAKALEPTFGQRYVVRDENGAPKTDAACRDAWRDAKRRAGLAMMPYTVKDIRAKAITDAKRAGYDIEALQIAAAHSDRATTEGYIKSRDVPVSTIRMALPAA